MNSNRWNDALKKTAAICLALILFVLPGISGAKAESKCAQYAGMSAEDIVAQMTLKEKASQMVQPACYQTNPGAMRINCYGSVLSQGEHLNAEEWRKYVNAFQTAALESDAGIPFIYGQDDVHGVGYCVGAVVFPHNIGLGAANDEDLMYRIGKVTGEEARECGMLWNFAPVVAQSADPRWGRTYESYGSDIAMSTRLSTAYTKGLMESGIVACPKHFFGDGNVAFGTGESSDTPRLMDRGDARISDEHIRELLSVYQAQIDAGAQTIMISFSCLNGVKMHENKKYIDILKNEMGFKGYLISDWNAVQQTSPGTYYEQVVTVVNAGVDMLMEVDTADLARDMIVKGVENGDIPEERVDDAARRIIQVKLDAGIFADPFGETAAPEHETGSEEHRAVAREAVEKSLVLIKNEGGILPLKSGMSVYIMGPAADNEPAQCGGWTVEWFMVSEERIPGVTTILEGFKQKAEEYGIRIITKESEADQADVILLAVGERAYAEWYGDQADPDLCSSVGLSGNKKAIEKAKKFGKPVVACIVAGRNVFISDYAEDWDGIVMCYLPGSEGQGVVNVLCGKKPFTGRLPSPWYSSAEQIGTEEAWLPAGYGLSIE